MSLKGLIFDLDGVLTDTAKYHFLAWKKLADELNMSFTEKDNELLKGVSRIESFGIILKINGCSNEFSDEEKERLANLKNDYYREMIEQLTPEDILRGVLPFINAAKQNELKCAVASISKNAPRVLELLGISDLFDYIADAAAVTKPKPDPEIFLTCAKALGFKPNECIGFEDAQAGIEAIHSAGMLSVGINVSVTSAEPDIILTSTNELDLAKIKQVFDEREQI